MRYVIEGGGVSIRFESIQIDLCPLIWHNVGQLV